MGAPWSKKNGSLSIPTLNRKIVDYWYRKAEGAAAKDHADQFTFSWIVLNCYYAAYAESCPDPSWGTNDPGEKQQLLNFASCSVHKNIKPLFDSLHNVKGRKISLPLKDCRDRDVPRGLSVGYYEAAQLSTAQFLEVLYQVRCYFLHGERGVIAFEDQEMMRFVAEPTYEYVKMLIKETPLGVR